MIAVVPIGATEYRPTRSGLLEPAGLAERVPAAGHDSAATTTAIH